MKRIIVINSNKLDISLQVRDMLFEKLKKYDFEVTYNFHPKAELIISIGGDGTFNESMTGNLKRKERLLLSHIPVGTTNDVGAMFCYGKEVDLSHSWGLLAGNRDTFG